MSVLARYIVSEFLKIFFITLLILSTIFLVLHFFDEADVFYRYRAPVYLVGRYLIYMLPVAVYHMIPMAVLISTVLCITILGKNNELTALKSGGLSIFQIAAPILAAAAVISFATFMLDEEAKTFALTKAKQVYYEEIRNKVTTAGFKQEEIWVRDEAGMIWNVDYFDPGTNTLLGVEIFGFRKDGFKLYRRIVAEKLVWDGEKWMFYQAHVWDFKPGGDFAHKYYDKTSFPVSRALGDFKRIIKKPEDMTSGELDRYIAKLETEGYDPTVYIIEKLGKYGYPLLAFVIALTAVPVSVQRETRGGYVAGITIALLLGFLFWFAYYMSMALGQTGKLPPVMAAFATHVLFGAGSVYLMLTRE